MPRGSLNELCSRVWDSSLGRVFGMLSQTDLKCNFKTANFFHQLGNFNLYHSLSISMNEIKINNHYCVHKSRRVNTCDYKEGKKRHHTTKQKIKTEHRKKIDMERKKE